MQVRLHTRNVSVDERFREMVTSKVGNATRFFDNVGDADVEVNEEQNPRRSQERFRIEVTALAAGQTVRVESAAVSPEAALDQAVDKLEQQLRRLKTRLIQRSRQPKTPLPSAVPTDADDEPEIVRVKQFIMKPMNTEEAVLQLEMLGHDFFFFRNAESDLPSVLYRRRDGAYGLIEPA